MLAWLLSKLLMLVLYYIFMLFLRTLPYFFCYFLCLLYCYYHFGFYYWSTTIAFAIFNVALIGIAVNNKYSSPCCVLVFLWGLLQALLLVLLYMLQLILLLALWFIILHFGAITVGIGIKFIGNYINGFSIMLGCYELCSCY